jgi:hypothetical protein
VPVIVIMDRPTPHIFTLVGDHHRLMYGELIHKIPVETVYEAAQAMLARSRTDHLIST